MGEGTLVTKVTGTVIKVDDVNQYKAALNENIVPRNASGVATTLEGTLGTSSIEWLKAHIASGYWSAGDIKPHHSYDGAVPIDQGWFPCLGAVINETNYDAIHGAGSWDTYVVSSLLDGKYAPDLSDKYLVGNNTTTQDGASTITGVGNSGHMKDMTHDHDHWHYMGNHNHQWYQYNGIAGAHDESFNGSGNDSLITYTTKTGRGIMTNNGNDVSKLSTDYYTDMEGATVQTQNNDQSALYSMDMQPESIEVVYYIRII